MILSRRALIIVLGWTAFVASSALPALWAIGRAIEEDSRGRFVDVETGEYTEAVYQLFFTWWLPILVPVLLLGVACRFVDWRRD